MTGPIYYLDDSSDRILKLVIKIVSTAIAGRRNGNNGCPRSLRNKRVKDQNWVALLSRILGLILTRYGG